MTVRSAPLQPVSSPERGVALFVVVIAVGLLLAGVVPDARPAASPTQPAPALAAEPRIPVQATSAPPTQEPSPPAAAGIGAAPTMAPPTQAPPALTEAPAPVVAQAGDVSPAPAAPYQPPAGIEDWYHPPAQPEALALVDAQTLAIEQAAAQAYLTLPTAGEPPPPSANPYNGRRTRPFSGR